MARYGRHVWHTNNANIQELELPHLNYLIIPESTISRFVTSVSATDRSLI